MAFHPYLLISIIFSSCHQFIETGATLVDIEGSSYKLSTDVTYAIYETLTNDYLVYGDEDDDIEACGFNLAGSNLFGNDVVDPESNPRYQWRIVDTNTGYALRNVGSLGSTNGDYLSTAPSFPIEDFDDFAAACLTLNRLGPVAHVVSRPSAQNDPSLSYRFEKNPGPNYFINSQESVPIVTIKRAVAFTIEDFDFAAGAILFSRQSLIENCDEAAELSDEPAVQYDSSEDRDDCVQSSWVFIPLSLPSNCESITTDPSTPDAFRSLTSQISRSLSTTNINAGSFEAPFSIPEADDCEEFTTTFTRTQGSQISFGFNINYQSPGLSVGGILPLGQVSADYSMDWTYFNEEEFTGSETRETCLRYPSVEHVCPPRTRCERVVTTYVPPVSNVEFTINAICDGNEYTTTGLASVNGIVRIEYYDQSLPLDCPYYTTNYNLFEPGTLQFCDTCNNNETCEICRDGYILLDGVCITEATCENVCGGIVRGGVYLEVLGGLGPWSGGFCTINDEDSYLSDSCRQQLGDAIPIQETMVDPTPVIAPSPTDNPSNGEECVEMYEQCGGNGYTGPTNCCQYTNDQREWECYAFSQWHSQCNPIGN